MKRPSTRNSTIEEVARKAGLSVSTVSLVLNNKANVRKETRKKVQAVIAELDYHPQRSARGLATQSSGNIGFILTEDHFSHAEPFYTKIFLGSELEARKHNYYILLTTVASSDVVDRSTTQVELVVRESAVPGSNLHLSQKKFWR